MEAATGEITNVRFNHNITRNSCKGLEILVSFNVNGMKGREGKIYATFFGLGKNDEWISLKDENHSYTFTSGVVMTSNTYIPPYDNTTYTDASLFIPYTELHMHSNGFVLAVEVGITDSNNTYITLSGKKPFNYLQFQNGCVSCWGKGTIVCMTCSGLGYRYALDPVTMKNCYQPCYRCNGQKSWKCGSCDGRGHSLNCQSSDYTETHGNLTTPTASGSGAGATYTTTRSVCHVCNGTGKVKMPISVYTDEVKYCNECGEYMRHTHHYHTSCSACTNGYIENTTVTVK